MAWADLLQHLLRHDIKDFTKKINTILRHKLLESTTSRIWDEYRESHRCVKMLSYIIEFRLQLETVV